MPQFKPTFQIPKRSYELRGQLFPYLINNFDTIIIESKEQIQEDRILAFSHPFDDWVFDAITKDKDIDFFHLDNGYIGNKLHKRPMYYRVSYNSLQNIKCIYQKLVMKMLKSCTSPKIPKISQR